MTERRRPDPSRGVFETLLVANGAPVEPEAHLARLAASLAALFGAELPAPARELIAERSAGIELGRVRLTAAPQGDGLRLDVVAAAIDPAVFFPERRGGVLLRGLTLDGGLGAHKWADRRLLETSSAAGEPAGLQATADGAAPLLLDRGEEVLEAGWANVFAVRDGALCTPRTDGRILPGIARAAAIEAARAAGLTVDERHLGRAELLAAEEVFLTNSVRGVVPARSLDGAALPGAGEVSRLVGDALRRRWTSAPAAAGAPGPAAAPPPGPPVR
jgi:para-aminobenzoate synthetase/4-amino-4-deoxychorismate lyase